MTFLSSGALWGLAGIAVLVLLSLWRLRPKLLPFPHVGIWKKLADRRPPIRSLERPRVSLLLLAQIIFLVSVVLAWARPALLFSAPAGRRVAFVFDTSASMTGRLERVRTRARNLLERMDPGDEVTLYALLPSPWIHRGDAVEGLSELKVLPREMDVRQILSVVKEEEVYLFTDETVEGGVIVGTGTRANAGIVDLRREGEGLFIRVGCTGPEMKRTLVVERNGSRVHEEPLVLSGRGASRSVPMGDRVRLEPPDAFPMDDVVSVPPVDSFRVRLHGDPDPDLRRALAAAGVVLVEKGDVDLYYRTAPARLEGPAVVIQPSEDFDSIRLYPEELLRPGTVDLSDHPLVSSVFAEEVKLHSIRGIRTQEGWETVLSVGGIPAILAGDRRVVVSATWHRDGWPAHPSFPIFWTNVLRFANTPRGKNVSGETGGLLSERETLAPGVAEVEIVPAPVSGRRSLPRLLDGILIAVALFLLPAVWLLSKE